MSAYFIAAYDIHDPETYAKYNPGSMETIMTTLARHGGKLVCIGANADYLADQSRDAMVVLEFPTREAAFAWHDDPDYVPVRAHRLASTHNVVATVLEAPPAPA
ncbi:MAG: DUF1330 domain-containing protein [Deltaproteobacteria bacterium]|nr:MAG: DUF1330 domain-containing protein [Deltaproteobacteria bacterium]